MDMSGDRPLVDTNDDLLGYSRFAKHLADALEKSACPDGLVVALTGPWGSGKSTTINFVERHLLKLPKDVGPIVIRFNPWWFANHDDLVTRLLNQIGSALSKSKARFEGVAEGLADLAEGLAETDLPYTTWGKFLAKLLRRKNADVPAAKEKVASILSKQRRKVLVVVDDIDRLSSEEIRELFRGIKAVADFPNLIYLLAFDQQVVVKALSRTQRISGEAYLEKIVQLPFELPLPDKTSIRRLLFEKLNVILTGTPTDLFDQSYWNRIYLDGLDHFIKSPRDVVRLVNVLSVSYPALKGEVNPVDFIAIESLRLFQPRLYDLIRRHPDMFAGPAETRSRHEVAKRFHDEWLGTLDAESRVRVKELTQEMFPKLQSIWENSWFDDEWSSDWRKSLRICSPEMFPSYFTLSVPEGRIPHSEMKAMLTQASDTEALAQLFLRLSEDLRPDGSTSVGHFLDRLQDYTRDDIPLECIPNIVTALVKVGDRLLLPGDDRRGMFGFGNDVRIGRVLFQLLRRLEEGERFKVLHSAISQSDGLATIIGKVIVLGQQHGKYSGTTRSDYLVTEEHLKELEALALEKIRLAVRVGTLQDQPQLLRVLRMWIEWESPDVVKEWVRKYLRKDEALVSFLEHCQSVITSQTIGDPVPRYTRILDPRGLRVFTDLEPLIARAKEMSSNPQLPDESRRVLQRFLLATDLMSQGKDLTEPGNWSSIAL